MIRMTTTNETQLMNMLQAMQEQMKQMQEKFQEQSIREQQLMRELSAVHKRIGSIATSRISYKISLVGVRCLPGRAPINVVFSARFKAAA